MITCTPDKQYYCTIATQSRNIMQVMIQLVLDEPAVILKWMKDINYSNTTRTLKIFCCIYIPSPITIIMHVYSPSLLKVGCYFTGLNKYYTLGVKLQCFHGNLGCETRVIREMSPL